MSAVNNWPINTGSDGTSVTANTAATAVRIAPVGDLTKQIADDVMIDNPGPYDVFAKAGDASTQAGLLSVRVPANSLQPFRKGQTTHISLYCANTQVCTVHVGEGA